MELTKYAAISNYQVCAINTEDNKILGFTVCDRNGERVTDKNFEYASQAIEWINKNNQELLK